MRKPFPLAVGVVFSVMAAIGTARAAVTLLNPDGRPPMTNCPALDGNNQLSPASVALLPPPPPTAPIYTLAAGDPRYASGSWTYVQGASLNGTINVTTYQSKFKSTHFSGCPIELIYTPGPGDPPIIRWMQEVTTSAPLAPQTSGAYIDGYTNQTVPFYWTEAETAANANLFGSTPYFYDFPKRLHPPTSSVYWNGSCYLVSWDGKLTNGTVTIHDGVFYGFQAGCAAPPVAVNFTVTATNWGATVAYPTNRQGSNLPPWHVQSTTNLYWSNGPSLWTDQTNGVVLSNGTYRVGVTNYGIQQYFRLVGSTIPVVPNPTPAYVAAASAWTNTYTQSHDAKIYVRGEGDNPLFYQWYFNGSPLTNATNQLLEFTHLQYSNAGTYYATVSNTYGMDTSDPIYLNAVPDNTPPQLLSATASSNHFQVTVTFSEEVNPATSTVANNYQISGPGSYVINNASSSTSNLSVITLTLSSLTPLQSNTAFALMASTNITDLATPPNRLPPSSFVTFMTGP
jgi:hypothetical protein